MSGTGNGAVVHTNWQLERAVLGAFLNIPDAATQLSDINPEIFATSPGQTIFSALCDLQAKGEPMALPSLVLRMTEDGTLEKVGGASELSGLYIDGPSQISIAKEHCRALGDLLGRRQLIKFATQATEAANTPGNIDDALAQTHRALDKVGVDRPRRGLPPMVDAAELIRWQEPTPEELVTGILHKGSKLVLGGASKSFKTWNLIDLAISVAHGIPWWGCQTIKGRALYLNFEIQSQFFAKRLQAVASKKGVALHHGRLNTWQLRGHAADIESMEAEISRLGEGYSLIVFDPLYKMLGNRDENKAGDIAHLLNSVERIAVKTGAAVAFGAHYSKGNQASKESIDRIGGSGVFARDPDAILTMTKHEEENAFTVDPVLRNHPPIEPFVLRWEYPLMIRDEAGLDPRRLKQARTGRESKYETGPIFSAALNGNDLKTTTLEKKVMRKTGMSRSTFYTLLNKAESDGLIHCDQQSEEWELVQKVR